MSDLKIFVNELICDAGKLALKYQKKLQDLTVSHKNAKDIVTEADRDVEAFIVNRIRETYPEHSILGEESGAHQGNNICWVIDPIDGTSSFVHNQPFWSISIAVETDGEAEVAAVNGPVLGELYEAQKGKGATLNGKAIQVGNNDVLNQSIFSTGFACLRADLPDNNLPYFNLLMPLIRDIRRYGSAALDLCYIAKGSLDGFWEMNLQPYDIAAGQLILKEAGGKITDFNGQVPVDASRILASNGPIHKTIVDLFQQVKSSP